MALTWVAIITLGCGQNPPIEPPAIEPPPDATVAPALTKEELARAVLLREQFGLRADAAWARFVAAQPDRDTTFEVPLTREEAQGLQARVEGSHQVAMQIQAYGERHRDTWADVYIDQSLGGLVVGQFTKDLQEHEAAIRKFVSPKARWQLRSVEYTYAELYEARESIMADRGRIQQHGFDITRIGIDTLANRAILGVDVPAGTDPNDIARLLGNDPRIRIDAEIRREWTGGYGTLTIVSTTPLGKAVGDVEIDLDFDEQVGYGLAGSVGLSTEMDGVTPLPEFPATRVRVRLMRWSGDEKVVAGEGTAIVVKDRETLLTIIVDGVN